MRKQVLYCRAVTVHRIVASAANKYRHTDTDFALVSVLSYRRLWLGHTVFNLNII